MSQIVAQSPPPWTLIKSGWIKKYKTRKLKYFVLSKDSKGNVYLEYFESEKKSRLPCLSVLPGPGHGHSLLSSSNGTRTINITETFYIQKRNQVKDSKKSGADQKIEYIIDIYTKSDVFVLLFEDESDQRVWFDTIMKEKIEWYNANRNLYNLPEEMYEDSFDNVWQVTVTKKGIGAESGSSGLNRLCFTSKIIPNMLLMFKVDAGSTPSSKAATTPTGDTSSHGTSMTHAVYGQRPIEMQLNQVRKVARTGNMFHIELGRSSTIGEGALFMVADETSAIAMHDIVRNAMSNKHTSSGHGGGGQRSSVSSVHHPPIDHRSFDTTGHRESHRHMSESGGHGVYSPSQTSSPAASPPSITILDDDRPSRAPAPRRHGSTGQSSYTRHKDPEWPIKSGSMGSKKDDDQIYVPMGPAPISSSAMSEPASSMEEASGYLEMTVSKTGASSSISSSLDQDNTGYLDMSPVSSSLSGIIGVNLASNFQNSQNVATSHSTVTAGPGSHSSTFSASAHGQRPRAGTSGSGRSNQERRSRSGKSIFDVDPPELPLPSKSGANLMSTDADDAEFRLEKVKSFLEENESSETITIIPRAWSIGSRPSTGKPFMSRIHGTSSSVSAAAHGASSSAVGGTSLSGHHRVRSNTVGSRPPAFSPTSLSAASSTSSSRLLSSTSKLTSSSTDHMDHMEIDYTAPTTGANPFAPISVRKLSQGHRARSDSKSSTSSTTSVSQLKVKESEPWEAHLPSTTATLSALPSPINPCGQVTASSLPVTPTMGSTLKSGHKMEQKMKTEQKEGKEKEPKDKETDKKKIEDPKDSEDDKKKKNVKSSDKKEDNDKQTMITATDMSQSVSIETVPFPSSAPKDVSSKPSAPLIGPVRPPGHHHHHHHHSSSGGASGKSAGPVSTTSSRTPSLPPLLPSLPEAAFGSVSSLTSIKKETSPDVLSDGGGVSVGVVSRSGSGSNGDDDEDTVQYTVIQFNPTTSGGSASPTATPTSGSSN